MKIVSTIEARMTSSRLPGKVLKDVVGKPALEHLIDRLKAVKEIDAIVVATTINKTDDAIEDLCRRLQVGCYRGSENDVLGRVVEAAASAQADLIVEITGDCPLIDVDITRKCIKLFLENKYDYVANGGLPATFPDGFIVQVFPYKLLKEVSTITNNPIDREHVSYYIHTHPNLYKVYNFGAEGECNWPELAVTLDTPEDLVLIRKICEALYPQNPLFSLQDIVRFVRKNMHLLEVNKDDERTKKYLDNTPRSLGAKK